MRNRGDELKDLLCWGRADLISDLRSYFKNSIGIVQVITLMVHVTMIWSENM